MLDFPQPSPGTISESAVFRLATSLVLLFFLISTPSCIPDPEEVASLNAKLSDQVELGEGITTYYSDSAQLRVVLRAPTMENILDAKDPRKIFPDGLRVTFLDELGDSSSVLTARHGIYYERQNRVVVSDSVVWQSVEGQKLETDELTWQEEEERIFTDRFVVITQPDYIIYGQGLDAKQDFSVAKIRQVEGKVPLSKSSDRGDSTTAIPPR